jgi:hypothetical protein
VIFLWPSPYVSSAHAVSMSNYISMSCCPIHNRISRSPVVKQGEVRSLRSLYRHAIHICHIGFVSQDGPYCHTIPSREWHV